MVVTIVLAFGVAALVTAYYAVVYASIALAFGAVAFLLAAAATLMAARSSRHATGNETAVASPSRPSQHHADAAPSTPRPATASPRADAPPNSDKERPASDTPPIPREVPPPEIVMPQDIDAPSVAEAFLTSAAAAGPAVRAVIWRADGAGETRAVPVTIAGDADGPLSANRDAVASAISEDAAILESLTVAPDDSGRPTLWHYVVPIALGEIRGAVALDFSGSRPALEILNRISGAYRLPLAASLALEVAKAESDAAHTLLASARELTRLLDPDAVVQTALQSALKLTGALTGSVMIYDQSGTELRIAAAFGLPDTVVDSTSVRPGNGIAGWVAISGQPLVVEDLPGRDTPARSRGIRSAASVPIADEDGVLGVLNVGSADHPSRFTNSDLETLEALAHQTAVALRNARAMEFSRELYFGTLKALALAMETKDPYAHGGTDRVMHFATLLAEHIGLSPDETRALEVAAMLHDIGMPSVGEPAMVSDRPLTTIERGLINMHPVIAAEILEQAPALREVARIVYHHHERYDGSGYVDGLAAEEIPLASRVLAVADAFVAMTSNRPYRAALSPEQALAELRKESGTQFDPAVVDAFLAINAVETDPVPGGAN